MNIFIAHEAWFLLTAVGAYVGAMLLFWMRLFLRGELGYSGTPFSKFSHWASSHGGLTLLWFGAAMHLGALIGQGSDLFGVQVGVAGLFGWILVVAYLVFGQRFGPLSLGAFVTPVAIAGALYSLTDPPLHHFTSQLEGPWLDLHVFIIVLGYVALAFAFAASLIYLLQDALLKRKKLSGLWQKLPSLQVTDDVIYRATTFGLAMLSLGILTGVMWQRWQEPSYQAMHDPKVIFSLLTWCTFAVYLSARRWLGWRGRRTNLVVVYGFMMLVILFSMPHVLDGVTR